jgi:hypothetical protein
MYQICTRCGSAESEVSGTPVCMRCPPEEEEHRGSRALDADLLHPRCRCIALAMKKEAV